MYLVKSHLGVGKSTVALLCVHPEPRGFLRNVARCELPFFASRIKRQTELRLPVWGGWRWDVRSPSKFLFSTLLILPAVQSSARAPQRIKAVWKPETQITESCVFIFCGWHCFPCPEHACNASLGKHGRNKDFYSRRVEVGGRRVPQRAAGRGGTLPSAAAGGWETHVKIFVEKMLQLEANRQMSCRKRALECI